MNKFMMFCSDFEINLLLSITLPKDNKDKYIKNHIRNQLMDIFKKNSECQKEMTFEHFRQAL